MTKDLSGRILLGVIAGFVATFPMTAAMRRMHRTLPDRQRYPLPPREIAEDLPSLGAAPSSATLLYHFLYGGAAGALFAALIPRRGVASGAAYGIAVWAGSYLGCIPATGFLRFGTRHPLRRNGLMLAAHVVWGACLAVGRDELEKAERDGFSLSASRNPRLADRAVASASQ
ncbi:hypothetical protein ASE66_27945 [Bosea sp. Root483D1]|uniref:hypothetical protein n=1 Tax=Bosea sp. Root483D1 TaxID=1736544 RepID=UPI0007092289|nr:hypothetical protein [Bosea sp. Root483D1]KRE21687.1 hypothetical protein ASE66_27945 [Bosea sp. Root483D1]